MSYGYYPQPGSHQHRFNPPPPPNFQPQPTWGGADFYRAHAPSSDPLLFNHAWNTVRDHSGAYQSGAGPGVAINEARHWHHRAYGSIGELAHMLPTEIGHAAAYEAYRTWIHNSSMYEPLSGDIHKQREGLIGLAVAEASRLLSHAGRQMDRYTSMGASEAAAATASIIFYQSREGTGDNHYRSRSHSRPRYGSFSDYGAYADDEAMGYPRHRSRSHHRSHSRPRHSPLQIMNPQGFPGSGYPLSGYPSSMPPGVASSYPGHSPSYSSFGSGVGIPMPAHGVPYTPTGVPLAHSAPYHHSSYPAVVPHSSSHRGRSVSVVGYAPTPYPSQVMSANSMMGGIPMVLSKSSHKKHKHRHHRSRSRSRSRGRSHDRHRRH